MPGLMLTKWQACRLWNLEAEICEALLVELVREEFLARTRTGAYLWRGREPARSSQAAAETMN